MRPSLPYLLLALVLFAAGAWLRFAPSSTFRRPGFDEVLYRHYVLQVDQVGFIGYDQIAEAYLKRQRLPETGAELPPSRFLYICSGWIWKEVQFGSAPPAPDLYHPQAFFQDPALVSLRHVSALFSTLALALAGAAAWRWGGRAAGLGVLALMAFAPLQIHMAQHALIDGFFAFWAMLCLWALWECLQAPQSKGWLATLGCALTLLVLTKENSFFVAVGLGAVLVANHWLRFGTATRALWLTFFFGPILGVVILMSAVGGPAAFIETYRLLVAKASQLDYAIKTGDGPWQRYLVDLMVTSPVLLCLALGAALSAVRESRAALFLLLFTLGTYLVMCNVRYGMNLRYATIWDLPLRFLAYTELVWLAAWYRWRSALVLPILVALLCAYDLAQYRSFFMENGLYELASEGLLQAVKILK